MCKHISRVQLISKGRNVSEYFAQVVKNVASQNFEIRKLVYIYLLRYAEQEPDLALLSINTFQKDLTDPSPLIRAMALRVLSGIKVPMIGSLVVLAIKKCAADMSPYVRKGAALAISKCYESVPHISTRMTQCNVPPQARCGSRTCTHRCHLDSSSRHRTFVHRKRRGCLQRCLSDSAGSPTSAISTSLQTTG